MLSEPGDDPQLEGKNPGGSLGCGSSTERDNGWTHPCPVHGTRRFAGLPFLLFFGTIEACARLKGRGPEMRTAGIVLLVAAVVIVGIVGALVVVTVSSRPGQSVEKSEPDHNQSAAETIPAFEAALVAKTRQLPAPEKEGLSRALIRVSAAYDCAREAKQLLDQTTSLLGTGIDNKQVAGAVSPHMERLKQLREKINDCAGKMETAENINRSYAEQIDYVSQRRENAMNYFGNAIDETTTALQTWEKMANRQDFDASILLNIPLKRLREHGDLFSAWIEQGMKRIAMLREANR
jgi:hypothetical protein